MGILTDFFIAAGAELEAASLNYSFDNGSIVWAKRVHPIKMAYLSQIVLGTDVDESLGAIDSNIVLELGDDGPWVYALDMLLVAKLAALTDSQLADTAVRWAVTEEWQLDKGTPEDLKDLLKNLAALAQKALPEQKRMYLRITL